MSTTYSIACVSCYQRLWVGQGTSSPYLYDAPEYRAALSAFLIMHRGHLLVFGDDSQIEVISYNTRRDAEGVAPDPDDMLNFIPADIPPALMRQVCDQYEVMPMQIHRLLVY